MWYVQLSRRDFFEVCLGGYDPAKLDARQISTVLTEGQRSPMIDAYWSQNPALHFGYPTMAVVPDGDEIDILTALNASPQAPTPFTALCRVISRTEAAEYFGASPLQSSDKLLPATVALAIVEAMLYSEGKLTIRTVSPAACRRTISYAWGRAAATGIPPSSLERLASRWIETYVFIGQIQEAVGVVKNTVHSLVDVLNVGVQLGHGILPSSPSAKMAHAVLSRDDFRLEQAWSELCQNIGLSVSLSELALCSREERGGYLQQALRISSTADSRSLVLPACAFLATRVAPDSLEHLEILRSTGKPEIALWYALYAALQYPVAILQLQNGLGSRVLRDIERVEDHFSPPTADISYKELGAISRLGVESIARKFSHTGEIEVEIVPLVTTSFSYHGRVSKASKEPHERQLSLDGEPREKVATLPLKEQIMEALSLIARLVDTTEISTSLESPQSSSKKPTRKKG
jgi:hypothetical protein